jgi:putative membrane protein
MQMNPFKSSMAVLGLASLAVLPLAGQTGGAGTATQPAKPAGQTGTAKPGAGGHSMEGMQAGKASTADAKFVHEAAVGGMAEVAMGKMAAEKAMSADVKQFGQRMVDDHSKANSELKTLASSKGMTLPADLDPAHKAASDRLAKLSGAAFDRAYMQEMVKDHDKDVAAFKRASATATDADLKGWAGKTLPTLEEHQKMAKSINAKLGPASAAPKK